MSAITKINRLLTPEVRATGLLSGSMCVIPTSGASQDALRALEPHLPRPLSLAHRAILTTWNGLNLDVIRIFGVAPVLDGIPELLSSQPLVPPGAGHVAFGNDPSGFLYFENAAGSILSNDHDGGDVKVLAASLDEFIDQFVFGTGGDAFMGSDWLEELKAAGLA